MKFRIFGLALLILLACRTSLPAPTPDPTPTPIILPDPTPTFLPIPPTAVVTAEPLPPGSTNCFGITYPDGYNSVGPDPCWNAPEFDVELWRLPEFDYLEDQRVASGWGNADMLVQEPADQRTPAYMFRGTGYYINDFYRYVRITITQLDGNFGLGFGRQFEQRCYNLKAFGRTDINSSYNDYSQINFQARLTPTEESGESVVLPAPQELFRRHDFEFTWTVYSFHPQYRRVDFYVHVVSATYSGNIEIFSLDVLTAPLTECLAPDGSLRPTVTGM